MKIRRVVVKLGTNIVIENATNASPAMERLSSIVSDIASIRERGVEVVIVTSGAIGLGRSILKEGAEKAAQSEKPPSAFSKERSLVEKQVCATVGQSALMKVWSELFAEFSVITAQLLLTALDFERRESYLNVHATIEELLQRGIVPIINENDATSVKEIQEDAELSFGDNDRLSAIVASRIGAQRLVILTSTDGIFSANPELDNEASLIREISTLTLLESISTQGSSSGGRGGMRAKLSAVKIAATCGVTVHVASGFKAPAVSRALFNGEGTTIRGSSGVSLRKGWIGHSSGFKGVVAVNDGAKHALLLLGSSLLPVGILSVRGDFTAGEVVRVEDSEGIELGRGVVNYDSLTLSKLAGKRSREFREMLDREWCEEEAIHRNNLVLFVREQDNE